ncbi:hypothetical protein GCM10007933_02260 [Zoogloea oryzae]|uniref:Lysozyme n=1 Tax=Zoogloea oryzae TaxID=310767 RepID=A0ABQ6F684_9RHOO|nr:hypothetical protein GCM10007933_02260 [Zoogloea oryzae]
MIVWTVPIPWAWRALVWGVLLIAAGVVGWLDGTTRAGSEALRRDQVAAEVVGRRVGELQEQARAAERKHAEALAEVSRDYQEKISERDRQRTADRAALLSGALRLRDPGPAPAGRSVAASAGAGSCGCDGPPSRELSGAAAGFLLDLAADADAVADQLAACQRVVTEDRAAGGVP